MISILKIYILKVVQEKYKQQKELSESKRKVELLQKKEKLEKKLLERERALQEAEKNGRMVFLKPLKNTKVGSISMKTKKPHIMKKSIVKGQKNKSLLSFDDEDDDDF